MTTPESVIKTKVKKVLNEQGVYYFMGVQTGYGPAGLDYHCVILVKNYPLAFFVETKAPGKKPTPRQESLIAKLREEYKCKVWIIDDDMGVKSLELWLQTIKGT